MSLILLALACQGSSDDTSPTDATGETGTTPTLAHTGTGGTTDTPTTTTETGTTTDTQLPPGLNGVPPAVAKPAPQFFAVLNRDNTARSQADLTDGHPTVLWFYPAAGTAG